MSSSIHSMLSVFLAFFLCVDDWEEHTDYGGVYTPEHPVIVWFWHIIRNRFTDEERSRLLQFTTGNLTYIIRKR